jgi:hypothetical protein
LGKAGHHLLKQLDPFCSEFRIEKALSSNITARPRDAGHDTGGYWIADRSNDNRDCRSCPLCGKTSWRSMRDDQIYFGTNEFTRQIRKALVVPLCKAILDGDVRALDVTEIGQS